MHGRALEIVLGSTALSTVFGVPIGLAVADMSSWRGAFIFAALAVAAAAGIAASCPASRHRRS
jgi:predicted MFS family arabinose efflux permease